MLNLLSLVKSEINSPVNTGECKLSISLQGDGLSFYISEKVEGKSVAIISYRSEIDLLSLENADPLLEEIIDKFSFLSEFNNETNLYLLTDNFTFIPEQYYDEGKSVKLFDMVTDADIGLKRSADNINDIYILFAYNDILINSFKKKWSQMKVRHSSYGIISKYKKIITNETGELFWLNINNKTIELTVFRNNIFIFYNVFKCQSLTDILYFTIAVADNLKIKPNEASIHITGSEELKKIAEQMMQYFKNIKIGFEQLNDMFKEKKTSVEYTNLIISGL